MGLPYLASKSARSPIPREYRAGSAALPKVNQSANVAPIPPPLEVFAMSVKMPLQVKELPAEASKRRLEVPATESPEQKLTQIVMELLAAHGKLSHSVNCNSS